MFPKRQADSNTKESSEKSTFGAAPAAPAASEESTFVKSGFGASPAPSPQVKVKSPPSVISADLEITGNLKSDGDVQVEGKIKGDIHANLVVIGTGAKIKGEVSADEVVIEGHISGCVRGNKVRLTSKGHVDGDIIHKSIAIEAGAFFEGSVKRADDPLKAANNAAPKKVAAASNAGA